MSESPRWWVEQCLAAARAAAEAARADQDKERFITAKMPLLHENGTIEWEKGREIQIKQHNGKGRDPQEAASAAFLCAMPPLVDRAHTTAYIACVAAGLGHRYINALEAKSLMYSAQLALAAHRPRARRRQTTPTPTPAKPGVGASVARLAGKFVGGVIDGK